MSLSTTVREVDLKRAAFCGACREQLAGATRAAAADRPVSANPREER
jgi:predicted Zn-dependent protease